MSAGFPRSRNIRSMRNRGRSDLYAVRPQCRIPGLKGSPREPALRVITHELVQVIKSNVSVDWMHRASARANIRRHVKRLLRKYGYPPDLQDAAVQNVLQQAEALSAEWA